MVEKELEDLSLDELWTLHGELKEILCMRMAEQKRMLEDWLRRLERLKKRPAHQAYTKVQTR